MHPILDLPDGSVDAYAFFYLLAWLVGGAIFLWRAKHLGWPLDQCLGIVTGCALGGLIGASLGTVLFGGWAEVLTRIAHFALTGKSIVTGILGGFAGVEIAKRVVGFRGSTGPAFALAVPLGHAIGRLGCLCAGCCFGTPTALPWGIVYPPGAPAHHALAVHPVPLYEFTWDLLVFALLWRLRDAPWRHPGSSFRLYLLLFAVGRCVLEFVRGDSPAAGVWLLKPVQALLLLVILRQVWMLRQAEGRLLQPA